MAGSCAVAEEAVAHAGLAVRLTDWQHGAFGADALFVGVENESSFTGLAGRDGSLACCTGRVAVVAVEGASSFAEQSASWANARSISLGEGLDGAGSALIGGSAELAAGLADHTVLIGSLVEAGGASADSADNGPVGDAGQTVSLLGGEVVEAGLAEGSTVLQRVSMHMPSLNSS